MKIAVEGCAHGELDKIYEVLAHLEEKNNVKVDLLIICGDFQSVRNNKDLACMAVSQKYRKLNTFYKYHSGEKIAPVLTIFIGGNHEASNYLSEMFYGGWVCPNIYYIGRAGVINVGGVRIAGLSGIFKGHDYLKGHYEHYPFSEDTKRSVYHVRNLEVFRLKQLKEPIDVMISHDWPRGVYNYGNTRELLRQKKFFRQEVESNTLGSRPAEDLLKEMKPAYWFAAHLHCKFVAMVPHSDSPHEQNFTKFLALDKCLPRRKFLQVVDIGAPLPTGSSPILEHDPAWLAVLRSTNHLLNLTRQTQFMPGPGSQERWDFIPTESEMKEVSELLDTLVISPDLFQRTAPSHGDNINKEKQFPWPNPQTLRLTRALALTDPAVQLAPTSETANLSLSEPLTSNACSDDANSDQEDTGCSSVDPNEINLDDNEEEPGIEGLFVIDRRRSFQTPTRNSEKSSSCRSQERSKLVLSCPQNASDIKLPEFMDDLEIVSSGGTEKPCQESVESCKKIEQEKEISQESVLENLSQESAESKASQLSSDLNDCEAGKKRQSDGECSSELSPIVKRTMKRRNHSLYCSTENDE